MSHLLRRKFAILGFFLIFAFIPLACNLPGQQQPEPEEFSTSAAQTVEAQLTNVASDVTEVAESTVTMTAAPPTVPAETDTPTAPPPSATPECTNKASFVKDVTIPDNTFLAPGESFVKTWRLKNAGTCTWKPGYSIVFISGNIMGGPASKPLSASVQPNNTVNVSVDLVAPSTNGTHKGNWKLRDAGGVNFGIGANANNSFYVQIIVGPTPTPAPVSKTFNAASTGGVESNGHIISPPNSGDTSSNKGLQGFVTFNLSSIPDGATITKVKLDLGTPHDVLGDPFGSLGCIRAYPDAYGSLDAGDYTPPPVTGSYWRFCSQVQLADPSAQLGNSSAVSGVQAALASDTFQIRIQFNENETDGDGVADVLRPTPRLIVQYLKP